MIEIIGYLAAVGIGFLLGLFGGGGSILAIPVLVYLFKVDVTLATTYSLFLVGVLSSIGSVSFIRQKWINSSALFIFGIPSLLSVYLTRSYILPNIPDILFSIQGKVITRDLFLLILFALLMLLASYSMLHNGNKERPILKSIKRRHFRLVYLGIFVGYITALVGAGGGFLIVPVLVTSIHLPVKKAIGTSLVITSLNSLVGFVFSLSYTVIDWRFLFLIVSISLMGVFIGNYAARRIDSANLKTAFGGFVLVMSAFIFIAELIW